MLHCNDAQGASVNGNYYAESLCTPNSETGSVNSPEELKTVYGVNQGLEEIHF